MRIRFIIVHTLKGKIMPDKSIIYFDHAATTSPRKEVVDLFNRSLVEAFYNPASAHQAGTIVNRQLENARRDILTSFGLANYSLIFTSGATESNNLAIKGLSRRYKKRGNHIITTSFEHPSVSNPCKALEAEGFIVTYLSVKNGHIDLDELKSSINDKTILVSIIGVNNEVGFTQDISSIAKLVHSHPGIKLHVDAVQAVGKIALPYKDIDLFTVSMHKINGLKSSGLLIYKNGIEFVPLIEGGGQENNIRSGTNDVPMAIADALTVKLALKEQKNAFEYCSSLVKPLYEYLESKPDVFEIHSSLNNPFIVNFSLINKKASVFVEALSSNNIMVASRSACSSRMDKGSVTLLALGKSSNIATNAIRLSFGMDDTPEEINIFINTMEKLLKEIRS